MQTLKRNDKTETFFGIIYSFWLAKMSGHKTSQNVENINTNKTDNRASKLRHKRLNDFRTRDKKIQFAVAWHEARPRELTARKRAR